jgi:hypothetical protein
MVVDSDARDSSSLNYTWIAVQWIIAPIRHRRTQKIPG